LPQAIKGEADKRSDKKAFYESEWGRILLLSPDSQKAVATELSKGEASAYLNNVASFVKMKQSSN
jgi:hypothetical protein